MRNDKIEINQSVINSFFWHSLAEAYRRNGEMARCIEIYNMTTQGYKNALARPENALCWIYMERTQLILDEIFLAENCPLK